jgi:hypothetical protein
MSTKGRLGKLKSKLEAEHHHRANMAAAKTRYQQSVSERNKLMMGKIQIESSDMRLRMQSILMPSATSGGVTYAPASAKVVEQQQPPAQGSPLQEGFIDVEGDAVMKDNRCPPSPTRRNSKRAPADSPASLKRTESRTTRPASSTEGKKTKSSANEEEGEQAFEDMSMDPKLLDDEFKDALKEHETAVDNVERGNGSRNAVSGKLNKFMQKVLPGAEVEELKRKTLSLRLQLFKERISGASAADITRMATAAMGISSVEGAEAKPMMYGTAEGTWSDANLIPTMNVTPVEDQNLAEELSALQLPMATVTTIMITIFIAITAAMIF